MNEGLSFSIEVDTTELPYGSDLAAGIGARRILDSEDAQRALDQAAGLIQGCAARISGAVSSLRDQSLPKEVEATFGVKFSTEAGAILAKAGTEAHIEIKLKWLTSPNDSTLEKPQPGR